MVATYSEDGTPDVMNAAYSGVHENHEVYIRILKIRKTAQNLMKTQAFTVSMANAEYVAACDYVGLVSGAKEPNKFEKAGFHAIRSEFVNAPIIEELPIAIECVVKSYNEETGELVGKVVNVSVDEKVLAEDGHIDTMKAEPLTFDGYERVYRKPGEAVAQIYEIGKTLMR